MRRLPIIQNPSPEPHRSGWQWVFAGASATLLIWTPLAILTLPVGASAVLGSFALSNALSAGIMVRFGKAISLRHVLSSATLSSTLCLLIALLGATGVDRWFAAAAYLAMLALALPSAWLAARVTRPASARPI